MGSTSPAAPMDCGDDTGSSLAACPHSDPVAATSAPLTSEAIALDVLAVLGSPAPALASAKSVLVRAERYLSPPPSQPIPLRL